MTKASDFKEISRIIMKYYKRGVITNCFLSADSMKCEISEGNLTYDAQDDFLNIFVRRDDFSRLYFYALDEQVVWQNLSKKTVCDFSGDDKGILKNNGFDEYISRIRLENSMGFSDEIEITKASETDFEEIMVLADQAFDKYSGYFPSETEIKKEILEEKIYVNRIEGCIAGFLESGISGKKAEIKHLCTAEPFRRRGVARELVKMFLAENPQSIVWTGEQNNAAAALYESMGFKRDECRSTVYMKG